jgi:hypothetical protein
MARTLRPFVRRFNGPIASFEIVHTIFCDRFEETKEGRAIPDRLLQAREPPALVSGQKFFSIYVRGLPYFGHRQSISCLPNDRFNQQLRNRNRKAAP